MQYITLKIEIADNPILQERGLMFRKHLDKNAGMLFKFNKPAKLAFWGSNTYIPLDIAFISKDNKIVKLSKIKPLNLDTIGSDVDCLMALEVNDDFFKNNGIGVGDTINIEKDDMGFPILKIDIETGD